MSNSRMLKLISGIGEGILAIPILGGSIVIGFGWVPLVVMFILHVVTLVISSNERTSKAPSILGIVTSVLGWIPLLGWFLHLVSAIALLIAAYKK